MDFTITLHKLSFYAIIGILPKEREIAQKVVINVSLHYSDEKGYIDYAQVASLIKKHMKEQKFWLLEEALTSTATMLKKSFPQIKSLEIEITKPHILDDVTPSVSLLLKYD